MTSPPDPPITETTEIAGLTDPADPTDPSGPVEAAITPGVTDDEPTRTPPTDAGADAGAGGGAGGGQSLLGSSAVMAAGTLISRLSGFLRSALLMVALGNLLHADLFNIANTVPNMLYILLAGGVFNAVLVPQLVRAMREDDDGGEAYTQRVVTAAGLFLLVVTLALVVLAPQVMSLYLDERFDAPDRQAHVESVVTFARYCLPQVFFYGMFVLVGQILNARGRFGPMMWAPIANNVIAVGVLVVYLVAFGPAQGAELAGPFTPGQEAVLGLGSTAGIVVQLAILVPYLRRAGFRFRPRFDLRGSGLGRTARLGLWTILFVVVNQIAYTVVVRLASGGTADGGDGTGYTVYSFVFLIVMVPHSVITVSLATAALPRLSALASDGDRSGLARTLAGTLRTTLVVIVWFAGLLPFVADDVANVIWNHGPEAATYTQYVPTLMLFGPGLVMFTVHYLVLRGFYALEQTRTVFWIQCIVASTNIAAAVLLVGLTDDRWTAPALALAYAASYAVGAAVSYRVLSARLGGLESRRTLRFAVRLAVAVALSSALAALVAGVLAEWGEGPWWLLAGLRGGIVALVGLGAMLIAARTLHLREVTDVVDVVARRLSRGRSGNSRRGGRRALR